MLLLMQILLHYDTKNFPRFGGSNNLVKPLPIFKILSLLDWTANEVRYDVV